MRRVLFSVLLCLLLAPDPAPAGYCYPDRYTRAELYPPTYEAPAREAVGLRWSLITAIIALIAFILGRIASRTPSKKHVRDAIEDVFQNRSAEATIHARRKLPPALRKMRDEMLKRFGEMGLV
jgi:hypothetical protein